MNKKKLNNKGFTLIELLAVITIMGILMMVAIPAVTRTIENSRRDSFNTIAKSYIDAVRNAWVSDNIECNYEGSWTVASGVSGSESGTKYYYPICTLNKSGSCIAYTGLDGAGIVTSTEDLMESGGKSSFGNSDVFGAVEITKIDTDEELNADGTVKKQAKSQINYKIILGDTGKHGYTQLWTDKDLKRGNVHTQGVTAKNVVSGDTYGSSTTGLVACKLS